MSRTSMLVLVALGAALAGFALTTSTQRADDEPAARARSIAAGPQTATLGWREPWGGADEHLVFSVDRLEITRNGWTAKLEVENDTTTSYEVASTIDQPFGLMVLSSGDYDELTRLNERRQLPAVRPAVEYAPELPTILEPGDSWAGTISAPGALVANSWIRVVFGALVSVVDRREAVAWISDHTYQLRP